MYPGVQRTRTSADSSVALAESVEPSPVMPSTTARAMVVIVFLTASSCCALVNSRALADPRKEHTRTDRNRTREGNSHCLSYASPTTGPRLPPRPVLGSPRPRKEASTSKREQHILEEAVHAVAEQALKADALVDEAIDIGHGRFDPLITHAKMLRLELLNVKADLERELEDFVLNCSKCGLDVHWVSGLGVTPGHWAHREPAPHGEPAIK
jgi:hypothetical protein